MMKNFEEPMGISWIAVQPKPYREERDSDQERENKILERETNFLRIVVVIMAGLLVISEVSTAIAVRFA